MYNYICMYCVCTVYVIIICIFIIFQLRNLVDSCINPIPELRPDIQRVYAVAQHMRSVTAAPPPDTTTPTPSVPS